MKRLTMLAAVAGLLSAASARADDSQPVKIGVLGDYSSAYSSVTGPALIEAARMAVEDFGGKALGRPIELVVGDMQLKPDLASSIARRWFDEGVDMITDLPLTAAVYGISGLAAEKKKILIVTTAASSDITGSRCSPYVAHWTFDTYSLAYSTGSAVMKGGAPTWFLIGMDNAVGTTTQADVTKVVTANGGAVVGAARTPVETLDYSSMLLQAQTSKAKVLAVAMGGTSAVVALKQAAEFGLPQSGVKLVSIFMMPDDVRAIGLQAAQGIVFTTASPPDLDAESAAFSKRFLARAGKTPNMLMVGTYSAVSHYLKAVEAAGTKDADKVMAKMRELPVRDVFTKEGQLRVDGRMAHPMYLVQVKTPAESKDEWDVTKILEKVPTDVATRPLDKGGCPLVK